MLRLQKTYRTGWDEMIRGYLETTTMHALMNVGLIDEMQKQPSVDIDEFAAHANLEPAVLQPLCEAFYCLGMFERSGARYSLSEKGRNIVEVMRGWLEVCYGYSEVFHSLEPLLRKEKVYSKRSLLAVGLREAHRWDRWCESRPLLPLVPFKVRRPSRLLLDDYDVPFAYIIGGKCRQPAVPDQRHQLGCQGHLQFLQSCQKSASHRSPSIFHLVFFASSAARSSSATRASMSSISMALAPCVSTRSAARSFVDGWVCWSTMTLSTVETAALADCCNRAVPCPNASRRAFRKTLSNSGSCCHRYKVRGVILTARAACSTFVVVRSARIASCCFGLNSVTFPDILRHPRRVHRQFFPMVDLFQKGLYFQALRRDSCDDHAARVKKDNDYDDFPYQRNERNSCVFEPRRGRRRNRNYFVRFVDSES